MGFALRRDGDRLRHLARHSSPDVRPPCMYLSGVTGSGGWRVATTRSSGQSRNTLKYPRPSDGVATRAAMVPKSLEALPSLVPHAAALSQQMQGDMAWRMLSAEAGHGLLRAWTG